LALKKMRVESIEEFFDRVRQDPKGVAGATRRAGEGINLRTSTIHGRVSVNETTTFEDP
jgi:hypothetical protein